MVGAVRLAGVRSTERAVENGLCTTVCVASDAEERVVRNLLRMCQEKGILVEFFDSMAELGKFAGLRVGAAACAVLSDPEELAKRRRSEVADNQSVGETGPSNDKSDVQISCA